MTIECYTKICPYHSYHEGDDQGPFCHEIKCQMTPEWLKTIDTLMRPVNHTNGPVDPSRLPDAHMVKTPCFFKATYEWLINDTDTDDHGSLRTCVFFEAVSPADAFRQFMGIYNHTQPLISIIIEPAFRYNKYAELEKEHFGDPDKKTGIYAE